jgi:trimeric autotransporter adhesin
MKNRKITFAATLLALFCFAHLPKSQAVNPPPDGGYAGGNTAEGQNALFNLTSGTFNTAVGFFSLRALTDGDFNTATGAGTLIANTADENTAIGTGVLLSNTIGGSNTGTGAFALFSNTEGEFNTATGVNALFSNTEGKNNTANGFQALLNNTAGAQNTAIGNQALLSNTEGSNNTASGFQALLNNTSGMLNTANGIQALLNNTSGAFNTAMGFAALQSNTTGGNNIALGFNAGGNLTTGFSNIDVGNPGLRDESGTIRIGDNGSQTRTFIAGIRGVTTGNADAVNVVVDSDGQLGTTSSSRRFKKEIQPMDQASEAILALKPVTFYYKNDSTNTPQFGLIAEEVADVNPDLVVRDKNGEIYTVRYDQVNAMLLNEFLKEHRKVEKQQAMIGQLESTLASLRNNFEITATKQQKEIEALTSGLQKISAQVGLSPLGAKAIATN